MCLFVVTRHPELVSGAIPFDKKASNWIDAEIIQHDSKFDF